MSGALTSPTAGQAVITRPLRLDRNSGFDIAGEHSLDIQGAICTPASADPARCEDPDTPGAHPPALLLKLGDGHLTLSGANHYRGNTALRQGSLGLQSSQALGAVSNTPDMAGGTRLDLADGITVQQNLHTQPFAHVAALVPGSWGVAPVASGNVAATLRVAQGIATWQGHINASNTPLVKDGVGTLRLLGFGYAPDHPLDLRQGGLQVGQGGIDMGQLWFGTIHARPDTVLSGTGLILDAVVAGHLRPGAPGTPGSLWFGNHLQLADSAQTHIPVGLGEPALQSQGAARLAGSLWLEPIPGQWAPNIRYTIVRADGGLDYTPIGADDPASATPVGGSSGDGRFARVHSPLVYLDPVLDYGPDQVGLTLRYNPGA